MVLLLEQLVLQFVTPQYVEAVAKNQYQVELQNEEGAEDLVAPESEALIEAEVSQGV